MSETKQFNELIHNLLQKCYKKSLDKNFFWGYKVSMKTFTYNKQGLGLAEMTMLAMKHSVLFSIVFWMTQHGLERMALKLTRMVI